jgi:hypothetical protein
LQAVVFYLVSMLSLCWAFVKPLKINADLSIGFCITLMVVLYRLSKVQSRNRHKNDEKK